MFKKQPLSMYQSSYRSFCSCPHPSCLEERDSGHGCQVPLPCQNSSESHLRLQASSLQLQMERDSGVYSKADPSAFIPSAFGIISRPSRFYVPSAHCNLSSQQIIFPFSQTSHSRQHGNLVIGLRDKPEIKKRRKRTIFTSDQLNRLESAFDRQQYLVGTERERLARELNLSQTQVKIWFQNRRIKWRKEHLYAGQEDGQGENNIISQRL